MYKLLHKPTGLFFKRDSEMGDLSQAGYSYKEKPIYPTSVRLRFSISRGNEAQRVLRKYYNIEYGTFPHVTFNVDEKHWKIIKEK